ncbi:carbohydrate ABC transporter permease [Paenibacillus elgii]|uniref:carbohydrate ABC transporter permease n=1 Tax=Paenibacillus elgii TaxID=189691 RepID=UPI00203AFF71|nr:sugar ABC transporter permease [Paenibacillus elgii]MCM3270844.1 sugar ABC transporter permease [Paenibacillus elgii]
MTTNEAVMPGKSTYKTKMTSWLTLETEKTPRILLAPIVLFLLALTVYPFLYAIYIGTQDYNLADPLGKEFVGLGNVVTLFADARFWNGLENTVVFMAVSIIFEMILGFVLAGLLAKNFKGSAIAKSIFLLPTITTPVVVGLIWVMLYDPQFGIISYVLGLFGHSQSWLSNEGSAIWALIAVDIWEWTPFVALILLAGIQSLPDEPYEAARVDGASTVQTFVHITLPLMKQYIVIALIFRFMDSFRWFDTIYVMTQGGPGIATETLNMFGYLQGFKFLNVGYAAVIGLFMLAVITVISQSVIKKFLLPRK